MAFQKATKVKAKLRLGLCGLAGSGKTFTALSVATELAKLYRADGRGEGRIAVIDSERGSASLYADKFDFDVAELDSFSPLSYVDKIHEAEQAGYDWIIIDSLTHAWAGKDGALDQKDQAAERGGNSWTAWRNVTPKHNALVDAMLGSRSHVIATLRQKMEYVQEVENGKTTIKKVGLAPIQREGMDYEFTLVGDVDLSHSMKIAKTRCHEYIDVGDQFEKPGENFARRIYGWLMNGVDAPPRVAVPVQPPPPSTLDTALDETFRAFLASFAGAKTLAELDAAASGPAKPAKGTKNYETAKASYLEHKARIERELAGAQAQTGAA